MAHAPLMIMGLAKEPILAKTESGQSISFFFGVGVPHRDVVGAR